MVSFFYEFLKGGFDGAHRVVSLAPASDQNGDNLLLLFLVEADVEPSGFLFHEHALVEDDRPIHFRLVLLLENVPADELLLPEARIVRGSFDCVLEESLVDAIGIALVEVFLEFLHFLFKVFGGFELKVKFSPHSHLVELLVAL
jgi:hypothetical protein